MGQVFQPSASTVETSRLSKSRSNAPVILSGVSIRSASSWSYCSAVTGSIPAKALVWSAAIPGPCSSRRYRRRNLAISRISSVLSSWKNDLSPFSRTQNAVYFRAASSAARASASSLSRRVRIASCVSCGTNASYMSRSTPCIRFSTVVPCSTSTEERALSLSSWNHTSNCT